MFNSLKVLTGGTVSHESCCDGRTWWTYIKVYVCQSIFSQQISQRNKILVHVSYPYHAYLESRPNIPAGWSMGKLFAIFLWQTYTRKKSQVWHLKKLNKLLGNFHISNILYKLRSSINIQKKVWLYPETDFKKIFLLG